MLEFLKQQLDKVEEELKELYTNRARSGVETVGAYDNAIALKKKEYEKLLQDIADLKNKPSDVSSSAPNNSLEEDVIKLIKKGDIKNAIILLANNLDKPEITLLSARYNRLESDNNKGILTNEVYNLGLNRIINSLIAILNE